MAALSHLRSFQALELALRTGSLKDAARVLAITPAAVGQRIKALEEYLGTELLVRGRSGLRAAPALVAVQPQLAGAFRELDTVAAMLDMQRGHDMMIAASWDFVDLWLRPRLGAFLRGYPNVRFCINGEGDAPLRMGPVDCEFHFGPSRGSGTVDLLFRDFVLPVGSPENTARISTVSRRKRFEGFPLLHLDFYKDDPAAPDWPEWLKTQRLKRTEPNRGIRYPRIGTIVDAVLANAGFAICGLALVSKLVDNGQLSLPFPVTTGTWTEYSFQARFRNEALARPQVRRFREWLGEEAAATRQWLALRTARNTTRKRTARR
jgi:LysR family transcriptional regulator, glycine cleavage system transcriptional activator